MNKKITSLMVLAVLMGPGAGCWADDVNATGNDNNVLKHPVNAYTNHEVKEDMKESQENSQQAKDAKAAYKQAKSDYDKSLKANGPESQTTKDAHSRMKTARKEWHKYSNNVAKANKELKKDELKAQQ